MSTSLCFLITRFFGNESGVMERDTENSVQEIEGCGKENPFVEVFEFVAPIVGLLHPADVSCHLDVIVHYDPSV